jgi:hypothetical protein
VVEGGAVVKKYFSFLRNMMNISYMTIKCETESKDRKKNLVRENIQSVQVAPLQPVAQVQMSGAVHVPPFWQGEEHTAVTTKKKKKKTTQNTTKKEKEKEVNSLLFFVV